MLDVITKNNQHPQGLPKIYVSGTAKGVTNYIDEVANDILQEVTAAIYYHYGPEKSQDPFDDLSFMQLFVFVLTDDFYDEFELNKIQHIASEVSFAIDHRIPILPIVFESENSTVYQKVFGSLQFLNRFRVDSTEIPYQQKLRKYLDMVIVGNELSAKIRAAFEAYIFLSYRKKDRKYALQLMNLIHSNDLCRDIAIWFDEYLTPGEDFNDSIAKALHKSDIFTVLLTPNLVNEMNYVINTEYPEAVKANMPILSVEAEKTNKEDIKKRFTDFPDPLSINDDAGIITTITSLLPKITLSSRQDDPQHDFFIGLAYLSGIDVEIDKEKAFSLIKSAADRGLSEAYSKIANMYAYGIGVERNIQLAVHWQQRYMQLLDSRYKKGEIELGQLIESNEQYCQYLKGITRTTTLYDGYGTATHIDEWAIDFALRSYAYLIECCSKLLSIENSFKNRVLFSRLTKQMCDYIYSVKQVDGKLNEELLGKIENCLSLLQDDFGRDRNTDNLIVNLLFSAMNIHRGIGGSYHLQIAFEYCKRIDRIKKALGWRLAKGIISCLNISQENHYILTGTEGGFVDIVDFNGNTIIENQSVFLSPIDSICLSPDGSILLVISGSWLKMFSFPEFSVLKEVVLPYLKIIKCGINKDNEYMYLVINGTSRSINNWISVHLYNRSSFKPLYKTKDTHFNVQEKFTYDGRYFLAYESHNIEAYDMENNREINIDLKKTEVPDELLPYFEELKDLERDFNQYSIYAIPFFDKKQQKVILCLIPDKQAFPDRERVKIKDAHYALLYNQPLAVITSGHEIMLWNLLSFELVWKKQMSISSD